MRPPGKNFNGAWSKLTISNNGILFMHGFTKKGNRYLIFYIIRNFSFSRCRCSFSVARIMKDSVSKTSSLNLQDIALAKFKPLTKQPLSKQPHHLQEHSKISFSPLLIIPVLRKKTPNILRS